MVMDDEARVRQEVGSRPGKQLYMPRWGNHMGYARSLEGATGGACEREEGTSWRPKSYVLLRDLDRIPQQ